MLGLLMSTPANSNEVIVKTKIIQKTVIKKVPIYLDRNDKAQIKCLADNAYFEAGNQSTKGKIAVTHVVMNRIGDHRFPTTPCGVIHQKHQFSWFGVKSTIKELNVYNECKQVAEQVYIGNISDVTNGAKFYHATYVHPNWKLTQSTQIGAHIFYRG